MDQKNNKQNLKKPMVILIGVLLIVGIIVAGLAWYEGRGRLNNGEVRVSEGGGEEINVNTEVPEIEVDEVEEQVGVSEIDTSDWLTYRNEEYGFEFKYPEGWEIESGNLSSFSPVFNVEEQILSFDLGIFDNKKKLSVTQWANEKDFFDLKQYEDPDAYVAHGISDPLNIFTKDNLRVPVYFGGVSGGGSTGTAIISTGEKMIVLAYSLPGYERREEMKGIFERVVSTFRFIKKINTANWKVCKNHDLNIQLRYPNDWGICISKENQFALEISDSFNGKYLNIMLDKDNVPENLKKDPERYITENKIEYTKVKNGKIFALRGYGYTIDNIVAVLGDEVFMIGYSVDDVALSKYSVYDNNHGGWEREQEEYWLYIIETVEKIK